jgi:hypothetical protein
VSSLAERRPAETGGVAGAVALLIVRAFGIDDPEVYFALGIVLGFVPAAITWVVNLTCRPRAAVRQSESPDS